MLPFLKPRNQSVAGVIVTKRTPDGDNQDIPDKNEGLTAAAEDFIRAVHAKDGKSAADAFQAMFQICESYPHEEAEHIETEGE